MARGLIKAAILGTTIVAGAAQTDVLKNSIRQIQISPLIGYFNTHEQLSVSPELRGVTTTLTVVVSMHNIYSNIQQPTDPLVPLLCLVAGIGLLSDLYGVANVLAKKYNLVLDIRDQNLREQRRFWPSGREKPFETYVGKF